MKENRTRVIWGIILIAVGVLALSQQLVFLAPAPSLVMSLLFMGGGAAFLAIYAGNRAAWWPVIPGLALVSIGALIGLDALDQSFAHNLGGTIILGGIGSAFVVIYLRHRENWWAVVPAGVLLTLALITAVFGDSGNPASGSVFFMGLGATFGALYLLPATGVRLNWAIIPAIALAGLGLLTLAGTTAAGAYFWPLALIGVGTYLLYRWTRTATA